VDALEKWMNDWPRRWSRFNLSHSFKSFIPSIVLLPSLSAFTVLAIAADLSPLAPLAKDEILATVQILREAAKVSGSSSFSLISLQEPSKKEVLNPHPGSVPNREAFVVVYERKSNQTFEAIVDLTARKVRCPAQLPD
jgi:Cu2+-containing amine oxidase